MTVHALFIAHIIFIFEINLFRIVVYDKLMASPLLTYNWMSYVLVYVIDVIIVKSNLFEKTLALYLELLLHIFKSIFKTILNFVNNIIINTYWSFLKFLHCLENNVHKFLSLKFLICFNIMFFPMSDVRIEQRNVRIYLYYAKI